MNKQHVPVSRSGFEGVENGIFQCLLLLASVPVREFLCLDDPPGPFDSLEESRVSLRIY